MRRERKTKTKSIFKKYRDWYRPVKLTPFTPQSVEEQSGMPLFATIDIEAYSWTNYVCGEVYWKVGEEEFSFETSDSWKLMLKCFQIADTTKTTNFVAHFGGKYDFLFFFRDLVLSGEVVIENVIPRGPSILCFDATLVSDKDDKYGVKIPQKITFRDSSALLPFGLGNLTKAFNVETLKGEMDFLFLDQVYKEVDYLEDILKDDRAVLFKSKKQIFNIFKSVRRDLSRLRYWNLERFSFYPCLDKISYVKPYMLKKDKKGNVVYNDWFEEITYPIFKKNDLLSYLHGDCKGLHQCITAFFNAPLIRATKKKWTTASQAVEVFRLFLDQDLYSLPDCDILCKEGNVDEFVRRAYFGGRTEVFKPIFDSEIDESDWLYYYDVNSLFPFAMANNKFPNKFLGWAEGEEEYEKYEMAIWHCKVKVPDSIYAPPLPVKREERLIFPVGTFTGYWTKHELEYAKTLGCEILEYFEGAIFEDAGYIFKNFINTIYKMRLEAKEKGDNVTQMVMKLIMNSCYGRMGINKERSKLVMDNGDLNNLTLIAEIPTGDGYMRLCEKSEKSSSMFSNPAIACFVTSYSRVHLHKQFVQVGYDNIFYADTDSVFTRVPMNQGKELGAMKLEYKCKSACFLLPKTYVNQGIVEDDGKAKPIKLTMKGFDHKYIRNAFTVEDFMEYLQGDHGNISVVEKPRFATFKTALRMGEFVTMKNDPETKRRSDAKREEEYFKKTGKKKKFLKSEYKISMKKLQGSYTKRKITKGGFETEPLRLYE
jgi:hypothetical protein